ncbi:hypothetical protein [uncultured Bradyrhizobium sp.]|jgi:hypothetical protein|uniref:hypothetical protein n=1 Tax=uncultured Bradyrhizobium sp. TaxID=199684 RepID=UPI0026231CC7|nr:hypothetical protein [uncultured Bradyrhizobium sp.]
MARSKRPSPDEPTQFCLAIDTRDYSVVRIFAGAHGYSLGASSYGNQHSLPLEAEITLIHGYLSDLTCMPIGFFNSPLMTEMEASLKARAAKMKDEAAR